MNNSVLSKIGNLNIYSDIKSFKCLDQIRLNISKNKISNSTKNSHSYKLSDSQYDSNSNNTNINGASDIERY